MFKNYIILIQWLENIKAYIRKSCCIIASNLGTRKVNVYILIFIFFIAFALRISYNFLIVGISSPPESDAIDYDAYALSLINGKGYTLDGKTQSAWRAPGFPFLLALIYYIFGYSYIAARLTLSFIGSLICVTTFLIGKKFFSIKEGLTASLITISYPYLVYYTGVLLSDILFTLLLSLVILIISYINEKPSFWKQALCGIFLGYSILTRPILIAFPPLLLVWSFLNFKSKMEKILIPIVICIFALLTILPWTVRNYKAFNQLVPVATIGGETFLGANNQVVYYTPKLYGYWIPTKELKLPELSMIQSGLISPEADKKRWELGIDYIKNNKKRASLMAIYKIWRFWKPVPDISSNLKFIVIFTYGLLLPFIIIGATTLIKEFSKYSILYIFILFFTLSSIPFYGNSRFRLCISPILILFACKGLFWLLYRLRQYTFEKSIKY